MHRDPAVFGQPGADLGVFVGVVVVEHNVQLAAWVGTGNLLEEVAELGFAVPLVAGVVTLPVAISRAANSVVVPFRT